MCEHCIKLDDNESTGQRTLPAMELPVIVPVSPSGECVACGAEARGDDYRQDSAGNDYCRTCHDEAYLDCANCHKETVRDDAIKGPDGSDYCSECDCELFTVCDRCSDSIWADDSHSAEGHRRFSTLCESCYDHLYGTCSACNESTLRDNLRTGHDSDDYCDECFYEHNRVCDGCSEVFSSDDVYYDERREGDYCSSCERSHECDARPFYAGTATYGRIGSRRRFGVELETSECDGYEDIDGRYCFRAEYDGSISGKEFVSTVLYGDQGLDAIGAFCDYAEEQGFKVDSSCGFHAHFDVSNEEPETLKRIALAYLLTQSVWTRFFSRSRRSNDYCGAIEWSYSDITELDTIRDWKRFVDGRDRYSWFNVASYYDSNGDKNHGTFEIRLHSASLNAEKVCNWVKAHTRFIDAVSKMTVAEIRATFANKSEQTIFDAMVGMWNDAELAHFYRRRAELFGTELTVKSELAAVA
jgi:hypothetical protein